MYCIHSQARGSSSLFFFITFSESIRSCIAWLPIVSALGCVSRRHYTFRSSLSFLLADLLYLFINYYTKESVESMFISSRRLTRKEEIEKNSITTICSLNLDLFASIKKLFRRFSFRISISELVFL